MAGVIATSPDKRELMPLAGSIFTTISAGVAAAQAIADTALQARSVQLAQGLQNHAVEVAHVQMGKLHLRLGFVGYAAGFLQQLLLLKPTMASGLVLYAAEMLKLSKVPL